MILRSIRNKVEGKANEIFNMYSTDLNWLNIKIISFYNTLLKPNNNTRRILEYSCRNQATINGNLIVQEVDQDIIIKAKREFFNKMCFNTFLSGLKGPLSSTIRVMKPENLSTAFSNCITVQNMFNIRKENLTRQKILHRNQTPIDNTAFKDHLPQDRS